MAIAIIYEPNGRETYCIVHDRRKKVEKLFVPHQSLPGQYIKFRGMAL